MPCRFFYFGWRDPSNDMLLLSFWPAQSLDCCTTINLPAGAIPQLPCRDSSFGWRDHLIATPQPIVRPAWSPNCRAKLYFFSWCDYSITIPHKTIFGHYNKAIAVPCSILRPAWSLDCCITFYPSASAFFLLLHLDLSFCKGLGDCCITIFSLAGAINDCRVAILDLCNNVSLNASRHHQALLLSVAPPSGAYSKHRATIGRFIYTLPHHWVLTPSIALFLTSFHHLDIRHFITHHLHWQTPSL
jgi:hypothetical protein